MATTPFSEVKEIAKLGKYRLIPIMKDILSDVATPVQVMRKLKNVSNHCFLLESVEDSRQWGRYSFLGYNPTMQLSGRGKEMTVTYDSGKEENFTIDNPSDYIRELVEKNRAPKLPDAPTFTGGLVGYFSYEYMQYAEPSLHFYAKNEHDFSDFDLMLFESLICFDNLKQKILLISNVKVPEDVTGSSFERNITDAYEVALSNIDKMEDLILNGQMMDIPKGKLLSEIQPLFPKDEYCRKVDKVKEHIVEGDIFQLVLSNPMEADFEGSLFDTYRILRTTNPSPYMFYFSGDTEIAGASPETLVKVEDGVIRTFPLAGTRPRGASLEEDLALEKELLADEKERAEHNMLVDLGRNDLGKLCEFGSVEVEKYMVVERYSHVMHIGSSVKGKMRQERSAIDAIDAVLPAGTLSGAPKIRACQIIDEL